MNNELNQHEMTILKEFLEKDIKYMRGLVDAAKANNVAKASETKEALRDLKNDIRIEIAGRDAQVATLSSRLRGDMEALRMDIAIHKAETLTRNDLRKTSIKLALASIPPYIGLFIVLIKYLVP